MSFELDAKMLAKTIIAYWEDYDDGDYSPKGYCCYFCSGSSWKSYNKISHSIDCPVLVAKDILTNSAK